jgi:integrase
MRSLGTTDPRQAELNIRLVELTLEQIRLGTLSVPVDVDLPEFVMAESGIRTKKQSKVAADPAPPAPSVATIADRYLEWVKENHPPSHAGHESQLSRFREHQYKGRTVGETLVANVDADLVDDYFDAMRAEDYSDHYIANLGKSIRAMLNWAARPVRGRTPDRLIPTNPLFGYQFPRPPGAVRGYVEGDIVRRFLRWAWGRARQAGPDLLSRRFDRLFLLMLRFERLTGCRPGEACYLRWSDIDWRAKRIVIPKERHKTGRKTKKSRVIHLTDPVIRLLRVIQRLKGHHPVWVFTHQRGKSAEKRGHTSELAGEPWSSGSAASGKVRRLRDAAIAAKVEGVADVGPNKLVAYANRHAYVSDAVSMGLTHEQTANLVGNTAEVISRVYAHAIADDDAARARLLVERGRKRPHSEKDRAGASRDS